MTDPARTAETSRDLFGELPSARLRQRGVPREVPPELASARALCVELRRRKALPEKQRIVHLICLNLIAMLARRARP